MQTSIFFRILIGAGLILLLGGGPARALGFGKNKLHTHDMEWHVFETEHFEIYYYPEEEELAREVCQHAETAYDHNTRLLRFKPQKKTPLFIYRNQIDFQQTNILPHIIGVGTGGFTEAFKNRIALPAPPSPRALREVILHEFLHALQFNILYGEGLRSFRVYKGYLIPLWIMEGLAEYAAQNWDSYADMVVRDAVLYDRLLPLTSMEGFNHLDDVYLAYKQSQLAVQYLADRFGEEKLAAIFKKFKIGFSISQILRETIGLGLQDFNREFLYWVRQKYWVQADKRQTAATLGRSLNTTRAGRLTDSSGPVWSPDGRWLAFISDQDRITRIYLKEKGSTGKPRAITRRNFEFFSRHGRPLSWSPDGKKIVFAAREEGRPHLYILNLTNHSLALNDLPVDDFYSPAWSPDGRHIALVGVNNGISDIYSWNVHTCKLSQITSDRWADDTPAWAPDGQALLYSTERGNFWQLGWNLLGPEPRKTVLLSQDSSSHRSPVFSPDGDSIYYSGDPNGIFNLFRLELATGAIHQITDLVSGAFQPALSPDGKQMAFVVYEAGNRKIYLTSFPAAKNAEKIVMPDSEKPAAPEPGQTSEVQNQPGPDARENVILASRPYSFRFSPDLIFLLAGYDSSQGLVGGGYFTASDYLGNHLLSITTDFIPGYQARTLLSYSNLTYPVAVAFTGQYRQNFYRLLDLETGTLIDQFNDEEIGGAVEFRKPFSTFDRMELEIALRNLRREYEEEVISRRVASLRLSLVHDSTSWCNFEPAAGMRHNLSLVQADRFLGAHETYSLLQLDSQAYQSLDIINPQLILGARLLAAASLGPEHPVFMFGGIGLLPGSGTLRGYEYGTLLGSQIASLNLELRFPLAQNINYTRWPLDFLLLKNIQMIFFNDLGLVTDNYFEAGPEELRNSIGLGLRLHTFLLGKELLTIRFDISHRTDTTAETVYTWGLGQAF
jgi:WD40 repeat protein